MMIYRYKKKHVQCGLMARNKGFMQTSGSTHVNNGRHGFKREHLKKDIYLIVCHNQTNMSVYLYPDKYIYKIKCIKLLV